MTFGFYRTNPNLSSSTVAMMIDNGIIERVEIDLDDVARAHARQLGDTFGWDERPGGKPAKDIYDEVRGVLRAAGLKEEQ